jgi:hypothetical protein
VSLRRDNGGQPTALAFMQAGRTLGLQPAFTRDNHPQGHAETARVMRTRNVACLWRQEWTRPFARIRALAGWITDAQAPELHAALRYQAPSPVERHDDLSHRTPFAAAGFTGSITQLHVIRLLGCDRSIYTLPHPNSG